MEDSPPSLSNHTLKVLLFLLICQYGITCKIFCRQDISFSLLFLRPHQERDRTHYKLHPKKSNRPFIQLLPSTNLCINKIIYAIGFLYPQHFNRLFKRKVGCTPKKYR